MNRIIIIGNGFDKAHSLRTGYLDFIDDYWTNFTNHIIDQIGLTYGTDTMIRSYKDDYVSLDVKNDKNKAKDKPLSLCRKESPYNELLDFIEEYNNRPSQKRAILTFRNNFFGHITNQCTLTNWLDIENEYYDALKKLLSEENPRNRTEKVTELNKEFNEVKNLLENHLITISENETIEKHQSIQDAFSNFIEFNEIATRKKAAFVESIFSDMWRLDGLMDFEHDKNTDPQYNSYTDDEAKMHFINKQIEKESFKKNYCVPRTLILNFNYTKTAEKLYINDEIDYEIINIHGELNNADNPIIFGYGDELDDDYKKIEKLQDNDFLENIKSINYHKTRNYRYLLEFIESGIFQVFVMGHSCGNSDRTLLNTLFEHDNCASIKVYYRQFQDGSDDYSNLIRNISRNFNDKQKMRDVVVNWKDSSPLIQGYYAHTTL